MWTSPSEREKVVGFLFGSVRVALLAVIPNAIPVLAAFGLMGWFGVALSSATSMIACVALGLVVDNTIHVVVRFRRASAAGRSYADSVREALSDTGLAVLVSTAALVGGFWVGVASRFVPTAQFSWITGTTLVLALVCDLVVLPVCLRGARWATSKAPSGAVSRTYVRRARPVSASASASVSIPR